MSTRGAVGFRIDGVDKLSYNHCDSYPSGLGDTVCAWLKTKVGLEESLREKVRAIRMVDGDVPPTPEDVTRLQPYSNLTATNRTDWYGLLRKTQGDLDASLAAGVMIDGSTFLQESLFCEWAYIVNLDSRELEVYAGFQSKKHKRGRYIHVVELIAQELQTGGHEYYPVALNARFSFDALPERLSAAITDKGFIKRPRRKGRVAA